MAKLPEITHLPRVSTGSVRVGRHSGRRVRSAPHVPLRRQARHWQDDDRAAISPRGRAPGRAGPLHHAVGDATGVACWWPSDTGGRLRTSTSSNSCRRRLTLDPQRELTVLHPAEIELSETTKLVFDHVNTAQPDPRRVRQSLRAAPSRAESAALSTPGARAQALLCEPAVHCRSCSTTSLRRTTTCNCIPSRMASCCWSSWRSSTAPNGGVARGENARHSVPRRLPRLHHREGRPGDLSATRRGGAHAVLCDGVRFERQRRTGCMLGGGFERGTNVLFIGAAGVGKSSLALSFAMAAVQRGEQAVFFGFDEGRSTLEARARTIGLQADRGARVGPVPLPADRSCRDVARRVRRKRATQR